MIEYVDELVCALDLDQEMCIEVRKEIENHFEDALRGVEGEPNRMQQAERLVAEFGDEAVLAVHVGVSGPQEGEQGQAGGGRIGADLGRAGVGVLGGVAVGELVEAPAAIGELVAGQEADPRLNGPLAPFASLVLLEQLCPAPGIALPEGFGGHLAHAPVKGRPAAPDLARSTRARQAMRPSMTQGREPDTNNRPSGKTRAASKGGSLSR